MRGSLVKQVSTVFMVITVFIAIIIGCRIPKSRPSAAKQIFTVTRAVNTKCMP